MNSRVSGSSGASPVTAIWAVAPGRFPGDVTLETANDQGTPDEIGECLFAPQMTSQPPSLIVPG
jgi:hypothetical protein